MVTSSDGLGTFKNFIFKSLLNNIRKMKTRIVNLVQFSVHTMGLEKNITAKYLYYCVPQHRIFSLTMF